MSAEQAPPAPGGDATAQELLAAVTFGVPELLPVHVPRPRLRTLLDESARSPLVLVSGPAGTGKTSLLAEWVRNGPDGASDTAWITFEDGDTEFWPHLVEGVARAGLEVSVGPAPAIPDTVLGGARLRALAAAFARSERRWTVVVDGFEMTSLELAHEIDFLLRHTFGRLRMVFSARVDPVLPLYRYRLDDSLVEVRARDLAFTDQEAQQLLDGMGIRLGTASVHDLNERLQGWVVGLRFAARALGGRHDPELSVGTVVAQTGDIAEYLLGEVLDVQTPRTRRLMLDSSVPELLAPGLVTELLGAQAVHTLEELARAHAFIEPVPDQPGSYRYYPFFRELLRARLAYEDPARLVELHRGAARWYARNGLVERSLGHLAAVGAWRELCERVVEHHLAGRLLLAGASDPLATVAGEVPADVEGPSAAVVRATVALALGDDAGCADEIAAARRAPGFAAERNGALAVSVAVVDAARARLAGDTASALALAEEAGRGLARGAGRSRSGPESELYALVQLGTGVARLRRGDLGKARKALTIAMGLEATRRHPVLGADCLGHLAVVDVWEGHLSRARRAAEESVTIAAEAGIPLGARSPAAEAALARVSLEQYDLEATREHVTAAAAAASVETDAVARSMVDCALAGLDRAGGRLQPALARLEVAAARVVDEEPWLADGLRVEAARLAVAGGRARLALHELEPVHDPEQADAVVVAATAHVELGELSAAGDLLGRLRTEPSSPFVQVTALLAEAALESRRQARPRARLLLEHALRLAEPEHLRRPFREPGAVLQRMLASEPRLVPRHGWLTPGPANRAGGTGEGPGPRPAADQGPAVIENLTGKELEVLGHLEELLTTEEIAEKMFVSVNTVRTHVRSILRKLGVSRRNAAVRKARELGLFAA